MSSHRASPPLPETPRTQQRRKQQHATKRITKEEKIFQLKSSLKISKEDNNRLKKEVDRLKTAQGGGNLTKSNHHENTNGDQKKFREAMRALKQVTVSQEKTIKTLRTKAQQRRKEVKDRDSKIERLQQRVKSLESAEAILSGTDGEFDLRRKLKETLVLYDEEKRKSNDLEEVLDLREAQMETVQKQRNSLLAPKLKRNSEKSKSSDNASLGSGSVSTNADFDVARLKTELAKKSEKINKLEMDLELMKDELHEAKRRNQGSLASIGGISPFHGQNSFQVGGSIAGEDDWTEAEDTYCDESEYGESEFGNSHVFGEIDSFDGVSGAFGGDSFFKGKTDEEEEDQKGFDFW